MMTHDLPAPDRAGLLYVRIFSFLPSLKVGTVSFLFGLLGGTGSSIVIKASRSICCGGGGGAHEMDGKGGGEECNPRVVYHVPPRFEARRLPRLVIADAPLLGLVWEPS